MSLCSQLRPYLDGEMGPLGRWRMASHVRRCPACSEQTAAEREIAGLLHAELAAESPEEAEAAARVERFWSRSLAEAVPEPAASSAEPRSRWSPRLVTAATAAAMAVALFAIGSFTGPRRALAAVQASMARVKRFHIVMSVPGYGVRYEAWGERRKGARVEEWTEGKRTLVIVDDGAKLRRYYPEAGELRESETRLQTMFQQAAGFNASRMLRMAARGKLFEGQEWLGEATAREVSRVVRDGMPQRRIHVDLKGGFFERMVIYAEQGEADRLTQANLYTDSNAPDEAPFARVFFHYPDKLEPALFQLRVPKGARVSQDESDLQLP